MEWKKLKFALAMLEYDILPFGSDLVVGCEPVYESMPGWASSTAGITKYNDLPEEAKKYLRRIEEIVETNIDIISTGPERTETILIKDNLFK